MAILVVYASYSTCGNCLKQAFMDEPGHLTEAGYLANGDPGCGEPWTGWTLGYADGLQDLEERVRNNCPELAGLPYEPLFSPYQ